MLDILQRLGFETAYVLLVVSCVFAWLKGGPAEQGGAICIILNWIIGAVAHAFTRSEAAILYLGLALDTTLALGFLVLALRFSSFWLGSCMTLQGANLTLQSMQWTGSGTSAIVYHLLNNLLCLLLLASLSAGTFATWRKRRREGERAVSRLSLPLGRRLPDPSGPAVAPDGFAA